jgi:ABC-type protease/lipase transport system fused ATPase/permease subunit
MEKKLNTLVFLTVAILVVQVVFSILPLVRNKGLKSQASASSREYAVCNNLVDSAVRQSGGVSVSIRQSWMSECLSEMSGSLAQ